MLQLVLYYTHSTIMTQEHFIDAYYIVGKLCLSECMVASFCPCTLPRVMLTSLVPRPPSFLPSVCIHNNTYTLLHELACNIASYCTSGCGIFTSRRRVKMQPTSAIIAICMLTSVIKCLLSIPEQRLVSSHTVTRRSNVLILIKAHRSC